MSQSTLIDPANRTDPLRIAVLGAGVVGRTLAEGWSLAGHHVVLGSRRPSSTRIADILTELNRYGGTQITASSHAAAAHQTDVAVVSVPGDQVPALVVEVGEALRDRLVVDTTNNLSEGALALNAATALQAAGVVYCRAYNSVGWEQMRRPAFGELRADLPYTCPDGNKPVLQRLINDTGFRPLHLGDGPRALDAVDAVARLWFLLAFERGYGRRLGLRILTGDDDGPIA